MAYFGGLAVATILKRKKNVWIEKLKWRVFSDQFWQLPLAFKVHCFSSMNSNRGINICILMQFNREHQYFIESTRPPGGRPFNLPIETAISDLISSKTTERGRVPLWLIMQMSPLSEPWKNCRCPRYFTRPLAGYWFSSFGSYFKFHCNLHFSVDALPLKMNFKFFGRLESSATIHSRVSSKVQRHVYRFSLRFVFYLE